MSALQLSVMSPTTEYVGLYNRGSSDDYDCLKRLVKSANESGLSILRICDNPLPSQDLEITASLYTHYGEALPIDLALMITQVIVSEGFKVVIVDGYLHSLKDYLPRLRWILSQYDARLILFGDHSEHKS